MFILLQNSIAEKILANLGTESVLDLTSGLVEVGDQSERYPCKEVDMSHRDKRDLKSGFKLVGKYVCIKQYKFF